MCSFRSACWEVEWLQKPSSPAAFRCRKRLCLIIPATFQNWQSDIYTDFTLWLASCAEVRKLAGFSFLPSSFSPSSFSFLTQLFLSLFVWTTDTINAFQERLVCSCLDVHTPGMINITPRHKETWLGTTQPLQRETGEDLSIITQRIGTKQDECERLGLTFRVDDVIIKATFMGKQWYSSWPDCGFNYALKQQSLCWFSVSLVQFLISIFHLETSLQVLLTFDGLLFYYVWQIIQSD